MKKKLLYLILPIITLILEILPYGAVCNFANPEGEPWRRTFSYFDLTPFGYANFAPFLTAIATCVILISLLVYLTTNKYRALTVAKTVACIGVILSLCPLFYGFTFFSFIGALITVCLITELLLLVFSSKTINN